MASRPVKLHLRRVLAALPPDQRAAQLADARARMAHWRNPRGPVAAAIWRGWVLRAAMLRAQARVTDAASTNRHGEPVAQAPQQPGGYSIIQARRAMGVERRSGADPSQARARFAAQRHRA